jgi:hypothetical protein
MKFFLGLNVALLVVLSAFDGRGIVAATGYFSGALASLLGAHAVLKTHRYYVSARNAFKLVERELGLDAQFNMATTPGMVGGPRSLKITTAGVIVLIAFVTFDVGLAVFTLVR